MSETEKRKGGGKLTRSETVTVRLDPKLRYLAELAARRQRRTLSSYIEWVIEDSLGRTHLDANENASLADEAAAGLWDVDEADRFAKLALRHSDLLTHEEQIRWKLIQENGAMWRGRYAEPAGLWSWRVSEETLVFETLRRYWQAFCDAAESGQRGGLPQWARTKQKVVAQPPATTSKSGFDDMDDDIPF